MINIRSSAFLYQCGVVLISVATFGLSACGQKGGLYLTDTSANGSEIITSSEVLASTSQPQDAAFAGIDDDEYQRTRYLEQQQILPEPSNDPNDY